MLRLLARLPLGFYHALGAFLGRIAYLASPRFSGRLRENLRASGLAGDQAQFQRLLRANVVETGKQAIEFIPLWFRDQARVAALVRRCTGEEQVRAAYDEGRGVILLTPHLGCFEIAAIYTAQQVPITVLYRQPHVKALDRLIVSGRGQGREKLAPATIKGVRTLMKALKDGEAVGILPDQVPGNGEGVWVDFFGRPAYTMTLIGRLCQLTHPAVFLATARRLPRAAGYQIEVRRLDGDLSGEDGARRMNAAIEYAVRSCPEQYLWAYNRYKHPAGAPLPPPTAGRRER